MFIFSAFYNEGVFLKKGEKTVLTHNTIVLFSIYYCKHRLIMETEFQNNSRRDFIIKSTLAALAMSPLTTLLSGCESDSDFSYEGKLSESGFHDDFHYFGDNLVNLHFYFLNAGLKGKKVLLTKGLRAYMVVKIPQQHIAEQLFREEVVNETVVAESSISGFSYLAFELLPGRNVQDRRSFKVKDMETLLQWEDRSLYELVIPAANEYYKFENDYCKFRNDTVVKISEVKRPLQNASRPVLPRSGRNCHQPCTEESKPFPHL